MKVNAANCSFAPWHLESGSRGHLAMAAGQTGESTHSSQIRQPASFDGSGCSAPGAKPKRWTAFTLLELLVVIGIIAVLAAILLPVLTNAKAAAQRTACLARLKQWALAFNAYANDNEWIPREGYHTNGNVYWNNWAHVQHPRSGDVWYNALSNHIGASPAASFALPADADRFYHRSSLFHCPSAPLSRARSIAGPQIALFSLAMNSQLITTEHYPTISFNRIRNASQTVFFQDNLLDGEKPVVEAQAKIYLGQPAADPHRFAGIRHRGTGNLALADGHAESVAGTRVVETQGPYRGWGIQPPKDYYWDVEDE